MGKFDGVLLVSDFDDTFLGSDRTVPARNYRALDYFLSEGGRFTIATGAGILVLAGVFPVFGTILASLPEAVLGGCTIVMFGNIVISGLQMIGSCGFTQRNITIAALSLSIGLGFTQVPDMFNIFPDIIRTIFAENCVAVVFITAIIMNLILPKNMEATKEKEN